MAEPAPAVALSVDATAVYFTTDTGLYKVPLCGGVPILVMSVQAPNRLKGLALNDTSVYSISWLNQPNNAWQLLGAVK